MMNILTEEVIASFKDAARKGNFSARGNHKTEEKLPELEADIRALADPESQADPKFQSSFRHVSGVFCVRLTGPHCCGRP
jgi:hypothetical protein